MSQCWRSEFYERLINAIRDEIRHIKNRLNHLEVFQQFREFDHRSPLPLRPCHTHWNYALTIRKLQLERILLEPSLPMLDSPPLQRINLTYAGETNDMLRQCDKYFGLEGVVPIDY
jgi:hypothetical protein